jgi:RNA polymerase sigma-70 factor, ECF subfamily
MDEGDAYQELRPLLFSIAYRMVGSVSEAEDLVQEAFLRLHRAVGDGAEIASPKAWLSAATTRLAIDHLRSARVRRERYVGPWLPEPLLTAEGADPAGHAETADSLSLAFLVLLERLSPVQRAVFLLHDVFGYGYAEVAELVGKSEDNCRQIAARARRHIEAGRPRFEASRRQREELASRFLAAAGVGLRPAEVNGHPGLLASEPDGRLLGVLALDIADGRVQTVRAIINPDKLVTWARSGTSPASSATVEAAGARPAAPSPPGG